MGVYFFRRIATAIAFSSFTFSTTYNNPMMAALIQPIQVAIWIYYNEDLFMQGLYPY